MWFFSVGRNDSHPHGHKEVATFMRRSTESHPGGIVCKPHDEGSKRLLRCSSPTGFPGGCPFTAEHWGKDTKAEHYRVMIWSFHFAYLTTKLPKCLMVSRKLILLLTLWCGVSFQGASSNIWMGVMAVLVENQHSRLRASVVSLWLVCGELVTYVWTTVPMCARGKNV